MRHLSDIFIIDTRKFQRLFLVPKFDLSRWVVISLRDVSLWIYYVGILIVFYGILAPWFLWPIYSYEQFIAFVPIVVSFLLSRTLSHPIFTRKDYMWPFVAYCAYMLVMCTLSGKNMNGYIGESFRAVVFLFLFMLAKEELPKMGDMLAKSMAVILIPSLAGFFLWLLGFPLPHYHVVPSFADFYSYENYFLFMMDDQSMLQLFPRFHSVFLEPSHMAMACVALLMTQVGKWKKWYNVTMFIALICSFSLAGYVFLVIMSFSASWMKRKAIMKKLLLLIGFITTAVIVTLFYNEGENLMNDLIVQRMMVNDEGDLEGDNRVSKDFDTVFEEFVQSDELLTGAGLEKMEQFGSGNSGYKVYLYRNGLISFLLLIVFFVVMSSTCSYKRGMVVMWIIQGISFIPHGSPLRFFTFIPLYIMAFREIESPQPPKEVSSVGGDEEKGIDVVS